MKETSYICITFRVIFNGLLTGIQDEMTLDIYRNILDRHLHGMNRNNHDYDHDLDDDSMDVVAFYLLDVMFHDYLAVELMPVSTTHKLNKTETYY